MSQYILPHAFVTISLTQHKNCNINSYIRKGVLSALKYCSKGDFKISCNEYVFTYMRSTHKCFLGLKISCLLSHQDS